MTPFRYLFALTCLAMTTPALAQLTPRDKMGPQLLQILPSPTPQVRNVQPSVSTVHAIIRSTDSQELHQQLMQWGVRSTIITPTILTAHLPLDKAEDIAALDLVQSLNATRRLKAKTDKARISMRVNNIHQGVGFTSPYTGQGVSIGVIDQGFEYTHPAFQDSKGNTRIKMVWDRTKDDDLPLTDAKKIQQAGSDNFDSMHATHVASIAAGTHILRHPYYGMAPQSDLYFFPSNFEDAEILENVRKIKDVANAAGKPWVVNMSFGSQIGPHDGTTDFDQALSELIEDGGFVFAAMGNEGEQQLHLSYTFTNSSDTLRALLRETEDTSPVYMDIWGDTLRTTSLALRLFIYNDTLGTIDYKTEAFWRAYCKQVKVRDSNNGKERYYLQFKTSSLRKVYDSDVYRIGIALSAGPNYQVNAWIEADEGNWVLPQHPPLQTGAHFTAGDNLYCVSEGAASAPRAIAVASYNTAESWRSIDGSIYQPRDHQYTIGAPSDFSSRGPQLNTNTRKPYISAPGAIISAAYAHSYPSFNYSSEEPFLTDSLQGANGQTFYYGTSQGTSMATPGAAGVVALWLQAYPTLPYDSLLQVLRYTSVREKPMGTASWDATRGYGRIDAYAGLKRVLQMKANPTTSIARIAQTQTPLSLLRTPTQWQLLFHNNEAWATVHLYSMDGRNLSQQRLQQILAGQEILVPTVGLAPGMYILRIRTQNSHLTRKFLVP